MTTTARPSSAWLRSFVPRLGLRLAQTLDVGEWTVLETQGVVLMADIVSFTPLSLDRASRGRPGQAELSTAVDQCVALVAQHTYDCGGELVGFAGDSLFSLFVGGSGSGAWDAAQACGRLILQGEAPVRTSPNEIAAAAVEPPLMRVGMAGGAVMLLVMRLGTRSLSVLLGDPVVGAARAQATAGAGMLAVDRARGPSVGVGHGSLPRVAPSDGLSLALDLVESFVPAAVVARSRAGHTEWLAEVRPVTALFLALRHDEQALDEPSEIARAVRRADAVLRAHGAAIDQLVHDEKGTVVLATFGAHAAQLGDLRPERAIRAGLALADALGAEGVTTDIGIATGDAVVGAFGDLRGRVFAVVGPHMNLAARLMAEAGGRLLVDDVTVSLCRDALNAEPIAIKVKGIDRDVIAHVVAPIVAPDAAVADSGTSRDPGVADGDMVGRERELGTILEALDAAVRDPGAPAPLAVIGEAGIGKTTLIDAAVRYAADNGVRRVTISGDPIACEFPLRALTPVLTHDGDSQLELFYDRWAGSGKTLTELSAAEQSAGPALGAEDGERGIDRVAAALNERLGAGRVLLTVCDAQWVDEATLAAVERLLGLTERVFILLECRSHAADPKLPIGRFIEQTNARRLDLEGMGPEHLGALAQRWLEVKAVSPDLVAALTSRAGGNPFFVRQLAITMPQLGSVAGHGEVAQLLAQPSVESMEGVPSTIHDVLSSRIDSLDPDALVALKAASVLGLTFDRAAVRAVHPLAVSDDELQDTLHRLVEMELIEPRAAGLDVFRFRHALYREVTYSLLTQPQRTAGHTAAAVWIERHLDPDDAVELLAHHWTQADDVRRAVPLLSAAARRAATVWAGLGTIELVTAAKRLADRDRLKVDPVQRGEWDLLLGQAYRGAGEMARGDLLLLAGLAQIGMRLPDSRPGRVITLALETLDQLATRVAGARRIGRRAEERDHLAVVLNAYRTLSIAAYQNDDLLVMALVNMRILNLVEMAGMNSELSVHYSMAGLASASAGARWPARHYRRLARRAAAGADELNIAHSRAWDSIYLIGEGQFRAAADQLRLCEAHYLDAIPGSYIHDVVVSLMGYVDYFTGRFAESRACYGRVYESGVRRGDPGMVAWGLNGEAMCELARGDDERVLECLERSRELPMERLAQIAWHSFNALASARLGSTRQAWSHADTAAPLLFAQRAAVAVLGPEYSALSEAALHLTQNASGRQRRRASELQRQVLRRFARLQRRFASTRPMYLVRRGDYHSWAGDGRNAARCYRRAMSVSASLGMPLDRALACLGSALVVGDRVAKQGAHRSLRQLGVTSVAEIARPGEVRYRVIEPEEPPP